MKINIFNQTSYKQIGIAYNGTTLTLKKDESIIIDSSADVPRFEVLIFEKNKVILNLLFALIEGFVDEDSVINSLYCNAMFSFYSQDNTTVVLKDIESRDDKNGYIYESVYSENHAIKAIQYILTDAEKTRKKAWFYYTFLVSWLLVIAVLLVYCLLFKGNILAIIASVLIFCFVTVPSWRKASKTKKYYNSEYANEVLLKQIHKLRQNSNKNTDNIPKDTVGKAIYKSLEFLSKKK